MVHLSGVDQAFLHVWLSCYRIKNEDLELRGGRGTGNAKFIHNSSLVRRIKTDHGVFKSRKTDLETYFGRSIIEFKKTKSTYPFMTSIQSVSNQPVFVCKGHKGNYCLTEPLDQLKAKKPIKMSLKHIFSIYDIHHDFVDSSIKECLALENAHNVECRFYHLDKNKAYWSADLPGFRNSDNRVINIAVKDGTYYWLASSNLIEERFYCNKTSKCTFYAQDKTHINRHEATCSDESIVRSKQVYTILNAPYYMNHAKCATYDMLF